MVVKIPLGKPVAKIRYRGDYDWEALYKSIRSWIEDRGYEFFEGKYKHKEKALGAEIEITFSAVYDLNDYAEQWLKMYIKTWNYHEKDAVVGGKKKKIAHGRMMIEFNGELWLDYQDRWESTAFLRKLRDFYHKFIIKKEIENIWGDRLYYEVLKLQGFVKKQLGMESGSDVYEDMW